MHTVFILLKAIFSKACSMEAYSIFFLLLLLAQVQFLDCQIDITEDGKDEIGCVAQIVTPDNSYSCKTLTYAMQQMADKNYHYTHVTVTFNVTYNQTISQSHEFRFTSIRFDVSIVGIKGVFLNFRPQQGIKIVHSEQSTWEWSEIGLACLDLRNRHCDEDHFTTHITHFGSYPNSLQFFRCKFIAIALTISRVQEFTVLLAVQHIVLLFI